MIVDGKLEKIWNNTLVNISLSKEVNEKWFEKKRIEHFHYSYFIFIA